MSVKLVAPLPLYALATPALLHEAVSKSMLALLPLIPITLRTVTEREAWGS